jgi:small conductance mechanosensitive channel
VDIEFLDKILGPVSTWGLKVIGGIAVLIVGIMLSRVARKATELGLSHSSLDESLVSIIGGLVYYSLISVILIAVFGVVGIETASLITVLGASSLAIGLALQGSLSNFASGIMLFVFRPFKEGDYIEVGEYAGTVVDLKNFSTTINTLDNIRIVIPNRYISEFPIKNWTANEYRRVDLEIEVDIKADIPKVRQAMENVLQNESLVLSEPKALVAVSNYGDTSVNFVVRPWCKPEDYWTVRFSLPENLKTAIESAGSGMPTPQRDIVITRET